MNETIQSIFQRRSVRRYKDIPVDTGIIESILAAGCMAPSAMNEQPWNFYVVTDKELIRSLSKSILKTAAREVFHRGIGEIIRSSIPHFHLGDIIHFMHEGDPVFHSAPVVIFITGPREDEWAALDVGMCAQNMILSAYSLGLSTCPVGFGKYIENTKWPKTFRIKDAEQVYLSVVLGYGDETPQVHPRKGNNIFYIDPDI